MCSSKVIFSENHLYFPKQRSWISLGLQPVQTTSLLFLLFLLPLTVLQHQHLFFPKRSRLCELLNVSPFLGEESFRDRLIQFRSSMGWISCQKTYSCAVLAIVVTIARILYILYILYYSKSVGSLWIAAFSRHGYLLCCGILQELQCENSLCHSPPWAAGRLLYILLYGL